MDKRFAQAHKEARWTLQSTLLYLAAWLTAAYLPSASIDSTGLPHWSEMTCLLMPLLFTLLCWVMVRFIFHDISLEDNDAARGYRGADRLSVCGLRTADLRDA